jgi:hypothetical protein
MDDGSSTFFGNDSAIYFDPTTTLNTVTGPISASQTPLPEVYATTSKAGFVQLADDSVIRGALGAGGKGVSEQVAVTAASLARELNVRLDNAVSGGVGISISQNLIELPGGDPTDPADDVLSYTISAGLPGNTDTVGFAGLTLGALQAQGAQPVTSIVNAVSKTATTAVRQLRLVTEEGLFTAQWIRATQVEDNTLTLGKIQTISDFRVLGRSGTGDSGNVQQVTVRTSIRASSTDTVLVTEKAVKDSLTALEDASVPKTTEVKAGSGLTGGGALSGDVTLTLGTPASITSTSSNSTTTTSHTHSLANGSITASKLSGGQSGTAPIYGIRHFVEINIDGGRPVSGSNSLTANRVGGETGTYDISFTSNAPPNANYVVIATSTDTEGDHAISVINKTSSGFRIVQKDIETGGGSGLGQGGDGAGCGIMVIY